MTSRARAWPLFVLVLLAATAARAATVPVPAARGWVNDYAGIIDENRVRKLTALIQAVKEKTGAEIAVLTVPTTGDEDIFTYAMRVAETWKPGEKGKDNGVVFVVASEDRKMYILIGYGLEGILPDGKVGAIQDEYIVPAFKAGDYGAGIEAGVRALAAVIAPELVPDAGAAPPADNYYSGRQTGAQSPAQAPGIWDLVKLGLIAIVFLYLLIKHPRLLLLLLLSGGGGSRRGGGGFSGGFRGFGGGSFGGGGSGRGW